MDEETLGQKHRNFNRKVQDAIKIDPSLELEDIDYNQPDMDNLFKIDFACRTRNVDYILKVFKCEDMLYVSRAIKHSKWLIKDPQYSHIINPKYLHTELFPFMLIQAKNKLLLSIRLNLKDPIRNEEFLNYLKDVDLNMAMKWFSNCSVQFMESKLEDDIYRVPDSVLLRLFSMSIDSLKRYVKNTYWYKPMLEKSIFLIGIHGEQYFDVLDKVANNQIPKFNAKYTKLALKHCPERLMFNFERYIRYIDEDIFVKYINKEYFQEFLDKYSSNSKVEVLFSKEKCEKIIKRNEHDKLLAQILECDKENLLKLNEILCEFRNKYLIDLKFRLHFLNVVIKKFYIHRFDNKTWDVINDIFSKIGAYVEYKKHFRPCIKAAMTYHVINNGVVPEEILKNFNIFDTFKYEQSKFDVVENDKMFNYLLQFCIDRLETDDNEGLLTWLDNVLLLLQDWKGDWTNYPIITSKIHSIIEPLKAANDTEALKKLYHRKRPWRKILMDESYAINSKQDACLNMLKHNPKLLHQEKILEDLCLNENQTIRTLLEKVRIYWPDTLGKDFKTICSNKLTTAPNKCIFKLLSRPEAMLFLQTNIPDDIEVDWNKLGEIGWKKIIAKNMHKTRPQPSLDIVLLYGKGIYMQDSFSSIKAIIHSMSPHQTKEYINKLQNRPEVVQKLCVKQAFSKFNKDECDEFILNIWNTTQYCSVRADIFKHFIKSLKKYTKNDFNCNDAYKETVTTLWDTFKIYVASLTEHECVTVYNLLCNFEKVPQIIRTEYCVMAYKFFRKLSKKRNSQKFINKIVSKIEYNGVLPHLDLDLLADMVNEAIIKRLWSEKLDWLFMYLLVKCMTSEKEDEKIIVKFEKILKPVLDKAYEMWNVQILNLYMVKYNMYKFADFLHSAYKDILKQIFNPMPLILIADSLQSNLPLNDNYVLITNIRLAAEYMKILTKRERILPDRLYEQTVEEFSKTCIKMFSDDVTSYGHNLITLFYHSLQLMLNGFSVNRGTQYQLFDLMLDLSEGLSSELNEFVYILVLCLCYNVNYQNENGKARKALHDRIKAHPSPKVKAHGSKLVQTLTCSYPYYSIFYHLLHDRIII